MTLTFDLDLEKFTKSKIFETYQLRKSFRNIAYLEIMHKA